MVLVPFLAGFIAFCLKLCLKQKEKETAAFVEEKTAINKKNRLKTGTIYNIIEVLTPCKQEQPTR